MLLFLVACRSFVSLSGDIPPDHPWPTAEPSAEWRARFDAAQAYHADSDGLSMLVVQGDELVYEVYANDNEPGTPHPLWSGTKTMACGMSQLGVEQGVFGLDDKVGETLDLREEQQEMTVRHLLQFTSGIQDDHRALSVDAFYEVEDQRTEDKVAYALALPQESPPGEAFLYSPVHHLVFAGFLDARLEQDIEDWYREAVLDPIGFRYAGWQRDPADNLLIYLGIWTTAAEWARFGVLLRDDGVWEGEQVLPAGTLDACRQGSEPNPAYGLSAWLNQEIPDDLVLELGVELEEEGPIFHAEGYTDLLIAAGARGQRVYVIPSEDMVVVLMSDSRDFTDHRFLELLLPE